jgi:hypothetical protein
MIKLLSSNEAQVLSLDASKAKNELAWTPKLSARQAINLTCEWYREQHDGARVEILFENQIKRILCNHIMRRLATKLTDIIKLSNSIWMKYPLNRASVVRALFSVTVMGCYG